MQITYLGNVVEDSLFIGDAFFDNNGSVEGLDVVSVRSRQIVIFNPDTGITTTLAGSGITLSGPEGDEDVTAGTITRMTMERDGQTIGTVSDISWDFVQFVEALDAIEFSEDLTQIAALFNSEGPITVDASGASAAFEMTDFFEFGPFGSELSDFITQPMTITGSDADDFLVGGQGNDSINPGANNDESETIIATAGNDTMDFGDAGPISFYSVDYGQRFNQISAIINGSANTGSISKNSGFTDTLVDVEKALSWGLFVNGTDGNDTFTATLGTANDFQWLGVFGGEGVDTYNVTFNPGGGANFRLDLRGGNQGVEVNLRSGNLTDSFGNAETITITGTGGRIEARGTDFNDRLTGSGADDRFITEQGDDTVNGGRGFDTLRYDRSGVDAMDVDLAAGTASGTWDGNAFTDTISNIEEVRGSRQGDDTLSGSGEDERLDGRGGNDSLDGEGGKDTLIGDEGNDTLKGGGSADALEDGAGSDSVDGGSGNDTIIGGTGDDVYKGGSGNDLIINEGGGSDVFNGGRGNDTLETDVTDLAQDVLEFNATTGVHGRLNQANGQDQGLGDRKLPDVRGLGCQPDRRWREQQPAKRRGQ